MDCASVLFDAWHRRPDARVQLRLKSGELIQVAADDVRAGATRIAVPLRENGVQTGLRGILEKDIEDITTIDE